jgi:hypothetical protein
MTLDDLMDFDRGKYGYSESAPGRLLFRGGAASTQLSRIRMGAAHLGISEEEYLSHTERGELWCTRHREWHPADAFPPDRRRASGRQPTCRRRPSKETPS